MATTDFRNEPVDPTTAERLRDAGLRMDLLDLSDRQRAEAWSEAATRGFHGSTLTPDRLAEFRDANAARRNTGVWDDSSPSLEPVGTSNSLDQQARGIPAAERWMPGP